MRISFDNREKLSDFLFFLYLCGLSCFKRGYGFDAFFCRFTFVIMVAWEILRIFIDYDNKLVLGKGLKWYLVFVGYYFLSFAWGGYHDGMYYINNIFQIIGVALFLDRKIGFLDIYDIIEGCMEKHRTVQDPDVDTILNAEREAYSCIEASY